MFGLLLALAGPFVLALVVRAGQPRDARGAPPVLAVLLAAYGLRMLLQSFVRDLPIFSYGTGGDWYGYELLASTIARMWEFSSIRYMSANDLPLMGPTSLPPNVFALVIYLNGEKTRAGCVAVIALVSCLTAYNLYRLSVEMGADPKPAFWLMVAMLFSPNFLYVTCDLFKDGLVVFFTVAALGSSFRLARRFSLLHLAIGLVSIFLLRQVRFYLVFLTAAPLLVGLLGLRSKSAWRPIIAAAAVAAAAVAVSSASTVFEELGTEADQTFTFATQADVRAFNARGGSGVTFDDGGSPFGALGPKILYTLFSPFPWQGGSLAMQIGKIDAVLFYYILYRAWLAARRLWREDRRTLVMFLTFLVPVTVAYATTMANVGLILRQRIPLVFVAAWLASLSWVPGAARARAAELLPGLARARPA
ncbi:MAG TPA: hypothetical protein VFS43_03220 [Polyangiaceae bacterium]|nr:hypothetical protein [Polyangiaceae bacterium]